MRIAVLLFAACLWTGCETLAPLAGLPPPTQTAAGYRAARYPTVRVDVDGARDRSAVADAFVRALIGRGHRVVEARRGRPAATAVLAVVVERERRERAPGRSALDDLRDRLGGARGLEVRYVERAAVSARLVDARTGEVLWLGRMEGAVPLEGRRSGVAAPAVARRLAAALPPR